MKKIVMIRHRDGKRITVANEIEANNLVANGVAKRAPEIVPTHSDRPKRRAEKETE